MGIIHHGLETRILQENMNEELRDRCDFILPIHAPINELICIVSNLQLALRHPANTGPSSRVARQVIDQIIQRLEEEGFVHTPRALRLGDNPEYDA